MGGTDAVTTTITKTKSVASGLGISEHRRGGRRGISAANESTINAHTGPLPVRAQTTTSEGVNVGISPRWLQVRKSKREKETIVTRVSKVLGRLPLSKLKIVVGD